MDAKVGLLRIGYRNEPPPRSRPETGRGNAVITATLVAATAIVPPFLLTALYPIISTDIAVNRNQVTGLVSVFFVVSALIAPFTGRVVARHGTARTLTVSGTATTVSLSSIVLASWHPGILVLSALAGGIGNGLAQPTTNQVIIDRIRRRRGFGLGVKQAAFPAATLLAGLAVPVAAEALTWRSTTGIVTAIAAVLTAIGARAAKAPFGPSHAPSPARGEGLNYAALAGVSCFLAVVAAGSLAALLVDWSVEAGHSAALAGGALAVASLGSAGVRLLMGRWADRNTAHLLATAVLMAAAPFGYAALVTVDASAVLLLGPALALTVGWGWDGVLLHGVIRRSTASAATSTGLVITGLALGTGLGPALTSVIAGPDGQRYGLAWGVNGVLAFLAAALMFWVHSAWDRDRGGSLILRG